MQQVRALDGVRGVAISLVVVHHIVVRGSAPPLSGWSAVDLFFALSGFLITQSILLADERDTFRLLSFYRRRFWRLAPALAVFLSTTLALWPAQPAPLATLAAATQWLNVLQAFGEPPFAERVVHLWSISAEVQFYVVWALALHALAKLRVPRWAIVALLVVVFVGSQAERVLLVGDKDFVWYRAYFSPDTRSAALATGSLAGIAFAWGWLDSRLVRSVLAILSVPAVATLVWATRITHTDTRMYTRALPLVAVAAAVIVTAAAVRAPSPIRSVLEVAPLPFLGRISYSLYLWHLPIFEEIAARRGHDDLASITLIGVPLALAVALASYAFVEKPLLQGWRAGVRDRRAL